MTKETTMNECNAVLFLDIDGVLSRAEYGKDLYNDTYEDYCLALHRPSVEALKTLLQKMPMLKIVWISDWAKHSHGVCSQQNCYIDPLQALELFPWIKERVAGDIYSSPCSLSYSAGNGSKLNVIESYVAYHNVKKYVIVDDYDYADDAGNSQILEHVVYINPLKSFLEDDLPLVEKALWHVSSKADIYNMFLNVKPGDTFIVNSKWKCTADGAMSSFKEDSNCPRQYAEMEVLAHDISNGQDTFGLIAISYDRDLDIKMTSLYTKSSKTMTSYESYATVIEAEKCNI